MFWWFIFLKLRGMFWVSNCADAVFAASRSESWIHCFAQGPLPVAEFVMLVGAHPVFREPSFQVELGLAACFQIAPDLEFGSDLN